MAFGLRWMTAVLATTLLVAPARAQPATQTRPVSPDELVRQSNDELRETLMAPGSSLPRSEEAARRLLSHQNAASRAILLDVLRTDRHNPRLAVAEALADDPSPDPRFIAPLLEILGPARPAADRPLTEAAAGALARFPDNPEVRQSLLRFAKDKTRPPGLREAVIRALGRIVSRDVGNGLVDLLAETPAIPVIANAAADALVELTGLPFGRDVQKWKQWQLSQAPVTDGQWQINALKGRSDRLAQLAGEQTAFARALRELFEAEYGSANQAKRFELTMSLLNSANPDMRLMGIDFVLTVYGAGQPRPPDSSRRIPELLADSDGRVRRAAATAIRNLSLNGQDVLEAILAQVVQEPDADVRQALAAALGPTRNVMAVPSLRMLLGDPSLKVAGAAADSLRDIGPALLASQPQVARDVAEQLWQTGLRRAAEPNGVAFRAACIEAMAPFRDTARESELLDLVSQMPRSPEILRIAALRALGPMDESALATMIDRALQNENVENVKREMIGALAQTGQLQINASTLNAISNEPNKTLRDDAWAAFISLASKTTEKEYLKDWIKRLAPAAGRELTPEGQTALQRQLALQLILDKKLREKGENDDWAVEIQNTGELYMWTGQPHLAAIAFGQALDYWKLRTRDPSSNRLESQRLKALLAAKEYRDASGFVADQIKAKSSQSTSLEAALVGEADQLLKDFTADHNPKHIEDAKALLEEAGKLGPLLEPRYRQDIARVSADLRSIPTKRTP